MHWVRLFLFSLLFVNYSVWADDGITIVGEVEESIQLNPKLQAQSGLKASNSSKHIKLLEYHLSDQAQQKVYERVEQTLQNEESGIPEPSERLTSTSKAKQLGMNNVPVFDQGNHGTCVTFAVTAALDATLKKGDYISQLCLLELGQYLENNNTGKSGWNGYWNTKMLQRIDQYGIINLKNQRQYGCGGVTEYPYFSTPNSFMAPDEYSKYSEAIAPSQTTWQAILTKQPKTTAEMNAYVNNVKAALKAGNRVTFGVLLPRTDLGTAGAVGWHHYFKDTWVLTTDIIKGLDSQDKIPGHAMIITGYDDNAVAMDNYGYRHHGLFTVRNSWGWMAGDWGDFYMSYDYFKTLSTEALQVHRV